MLRSLSLLPTAQVEVLSAALRASSLDAHEEAGGVEQRSELQDEAGVNELPDCALSPDTSMPLISAAEEVIRSVVFSTRELCEHAVVMGTLVQTR